MEKSNKKFSLYSTELVYNTEKKECETEYHLEYETDDLSEVATLYSKVFNKMVASIQELSPRFKSYYTRCAYFTTEDCKDNLHLWYDFGSHSKFIELHFNNRESLNEYLDYSNLPRL